MINISTNPDFSGRDHEFIFDETVNYSSPKFRANIVSANPVSLTERRWYAPILSSGEVADLLRSAKGPEPAAASAKDRLAKSFHRLVLKECAPYCNGRNNDDVIAAGMLGLAAAIDRFDLRGRNTGLTAFALPHIRGEMQAASKSFNKNGWAGETRLQRLVYGDHDSTVERASEVMGRPVDESELEQARAQVLRMCEEPLPYDTTEPGFEDDERRRPSFIAVAPPCPQQRAILNRYHGLLPWLVADADLRASRRFKEVGRRRYALELVERDRARIAARAEPTQYLNPSTFYRSIPTAAHAA